MMIRLCFFLLTFLYISVHCDTADDDDLEIVSGHGGTIVTSVEDDVIILTHENFDLQISKDLILVEFYAPWCGHCKTLAPEYAKAAKILKDEDPPILLAKVDGTIENGLAGRYEVSGFPTLFIFRKGQKFPYDGPRTAMGIVEYMKQQADPNYKPPPEAVLTLTSDNFTDTVEDADLILVEFYAPWCGHCKNLAPEYERAARALKELATPIHLAKIDGIAEKKLADQYGAAGWPTLMMFRKGKKFEYKGPREESGIISYMKEQAKSPSEEVPTAKYLKKSFSKTEITIIGFFKSPIEPLFKEYLETAYNLREKFSFYHSFSESIAKEFGSEQNRIIVYKPKLFESEYEPSKHEFSNEQGSSFDITNFIRNNCLPLVGVRSVKTNFKYEDKYPLVVVYYDVDFSFEHRVQTQLIRKEITKVANLYKGKIYFAISNEDDYESELITLGLDDSGEDVNVGFYKSNKLRYRMDPVDDFSSDDLKDFIAKVNAGKVKPRVKSQPLPKTNDGAVANIVGLNFETLVTNTNKDVLLEFYAPWCGHCKKLDPIYKKLGKVFADNESILIGKIDATANDYPSEFDVKGFPTIYYIPASDKTSPFTYDGERTLKDLTDFVNRQLEKKSNKDEL